MEVRLSGGLAVAHQLPGRIDASGDLARENICARIHVSPSHVALTEIAKAMSHEVAVGIASRYLPRCLSKKRVISSKVSFASGAV
jgi:hypothetical protein